MSPELQKYYEGVSLRVLAEDKGTTVKNISTVLSKERFKLGLSPRVGRPGGAVAEFIVDRDIVVDLYVGGMEQKVIADKWDISTATVSNYLSLWLQDTILGESVKMSDMEHVWKDLPDEFTITVRGKPVFKVVRV